MHTVERFINSKSSQLAFFVRAFLDGRIPYSEVELYFWDTMEEWLQIKNGKQHPCAHKEIVFWHLLHQVHYWPEKTLQQDVYLRGELKTCLDYLESEEQYPLPLDCIGIRP